MIMQRFVPIDSFLIRMLRGVDEKTAYFQQMLDMESSLVDAAIEDRKSRLFDLLEHLPIPNGSIDYPQIVSNLPPEDQFLIYVAALCAFVHFDAESERLPFSSMENFHRLLCAYLQESYLSFAKYCKDENEYLFESVFGYAYEHQL